METREATFRTHDHMPTDLRTPLPGDLLVSKEILEQIKSKDPQKLLLNSQAVHAYFAQAWTNLNEVCYRPEIKSCSGDIIEPPSMLMAQSVPAVSGAEQQALNSWMAESFSTPLVEMQTEDFEAIAEQIREFFIRRGQTPIGPEGSEEESLGPGEQAWETEEGEAPFQDDVSSAIMDSLVDNKLIFDSEEQKRNYEEIKARIRASINSGKPMDAGEILLWLTYLQLDQINRKVGRFFGLKEMKDRAIDEKVPDRNSSDPISTVDQMKLNFDMMKFSGDSNQINMGIQSLLSNRERLMTAEGGISRLLGEVPNTVGQALQKIS